MTLETTANLKLRRWSDTSHPSELKIQNALHVEGRQFLLEEPWFVLWLFNVQSDILGSMNRFRRSSFRLGLRERLQTFLGRTRTGPGECCPARLRDADSVMYFCDSQRILTLTFLSQTSKTWNFLENKELLLLEYMADYFYINFNDKRLLSKTNMTFDKRGPHKYYLSCYQHWRGATDPLTPQKR